MDYLESEYSLLYLAYTFSNKLKITNMQNAIYSHPDLNELSINLDNSNISKSEFYGFYSIYVYAIVIGSKIITYYDELDRDADLVLLNIVKLNPNQELINFANDVNTTAKDAIQSGYSVEYNYNLNLVQINDGKGKTWQFCGNDTDDLINEVKECAVYYEGLCTLENVILYLSQGW